MRKIVIPCLFLFSTLQAQQAWHTFVDPMIGTGGHGHTFPGATMPFGMVQLSPDTRLEGWDGCSGYHYDDEWIYGFSHTHLSGTGVPDYADILVSPMSGAPSFDREVYRSRFSHGQETAEPGYYRVHLADDDIDAEMSVTDRVGIHRYTFSRPGDRHLILDLRHRDPVLDSRVQVVNSHRVTGMRRSSSWARDQVVYFVMDFNEPLTDWSILNDDTETPKRTGETSGQHLAARLTFGPSHQPLLVKVGLSQVSVEGAIRNLEAEAPEWNFEHYRSNALNAWDRQLDKIQVIGDKRDDLVNFYTALYHCMIHPNIASDVDGRYRGMDREVHQAQGYTHYTVFSLWDTYRALHPLLTIIEPERTRDFIQTMLAQFDESGRLPVWELAGNETNCMIGYHAVSVIWDAIQKRIPGIDGTRALNAMAATARAPVFGLPAYAAKGYLETGDESESVSKTLEYAYDDWCIAQLAKKLRKQPVFEEFLERSVGYRHLVDPRSRFIRPRRNGGWLEPFDPREVTNQYTEANAWQYTFYAPHDMAWLMEAMGGRQGFEEQLDGLFQASSETTGRDQADITGLVGQYAQGNEPSHHIGYLYTMVGKPWKTADIVRRIRDLYKPTPDGLPGNEDCGQMSAWYVFSAIGFYPVLPGSGQYVFGMPQFPIVRIPMDGDKVFEMRLHQKHPEDRYVQEILVNAEPLPGSWIVHHFLTAGVNVDVVLGPEKTTLWGMEPRHCPISETVWPEFVHIPSISGPVQAFRDPAEIRIDAPEGSGILYSLDGSPPGRPYEGPFLLDKTTTVTAVARSSEGLTSPPTRGTFHHLDHNWAVHVLSTVHPQYTAGGPDALVDGMTGDTDWRKGGWQGYQGTDLEVVIDLGEKQKIRHLEASFLQDLGAWIALPRDVTFFVSSDGDHYKEALHVDQPLDPGTAGNQRQVLGGDSEVRKGRYVKVFVRNYGKLRPPHPGAGGDAYIFIDEIRID